MADSSDPKKETARIAASPQQSSPPSAPTRSPPETVRIHLPSRPPTNPLPAPVESPSPARTAAAAMSAKPAVEMKKTQPLIRLPAVETPATRVTVAPTPQPVSRIDEIPMLLCWSLLATSAAILILQIWNYLS